jgi:hypothetical protein
MGVAHHHLERPVPEQLCDGAQIHPGHHESTGKSMAVAMPGYTPRSRPLRVPSGTSPATPAKCPRCGRTGRPDRSLPACACRAAASGHRERPCSAEWYGDPPFLVLGK